MEQALSLAEIAESNGEVPVGAVLVSKNNQLLGEGFNQSIEHCDPTAHAEIQAIRGAASTLQNYRLTDTTLYVTLEPCAMCAGALLEARVKRLVFGTRDVNNGACGSKNNLLSSHLQIDEGIMQTKCAEILKDFFKKRRED